MRTAWAFRGIALISGVVSVLILGCGDDKGTGPDGVPSKIAFVSNRDGNDEIYIMNVDGTNSTRLTNNWGGDLNPAWSPDGTRIAFVSGRDRKNGIYVMNADGTEPTLLTFLNGGNEHRPAWSPDGTRIAFPDHPPAITDPRQAGAAAIYVMNADGTSATPLTGPPYHEDYWPTWSPDGTRIAFVSSRDGPWDLYIITADGANLTRLTNTPEPEGAPAWSPDGARIAYARGGSMDGGDIYVMNADGTNPTQLTHEGGARPTWSPDGTQMAFMSNRNRIPEVYVMNADGANQIQLTWNPSYGLVSDAHDMTPAWSPQGNR